MNNKSCKIYFDGGCVGNPGPMTIGYVIIDDTTGRKTQVSMEIGQGTNNVAEFTASLLGIKSAKKLGYNTFKIFGDSRLVINVIKSEWSCKKEHLKPIANNIHNALVGCVWEANWIPRAQNARADNLTKLK